MKKLILIAALAAGAVGLTGCGCDSGYRESNRCVMLDRNHTFTKATVMYGNTNIVYDVVAWRDSSDEVQLLVKDESSPAGSRSCSPTTRG